jgi:hypothetical protein
MPTPRQTVLAPDLPMMPKTLVRPRMPGSSHAMPSPLSCRRWVEDVCFALADCESEAGYSAHQRLPLKSLTWSTGRARLEDRRRLSQLHIGSPCPNRGSVGTSMKPFTARKGRARISSLSGFSPTSYSTRVGQGTFSACGWGAREATKCSAAARPTPVPQTCGDSLT